jgi:hypothetical protein
MKRLHQLEPAGDQMRFVTLEGMVHLLKLKLEMGTLSLRQKLMLTLEMEMLEVHLLNQLSPGEEMNDVLQPPLVPVWAREVELYSLAGHLSKLWEEMPENWEHRVVQVVEMRENSEQLSDWMVVEMPGIQTQMAARVVEEMPETQCQIAVAVVQEMPEIRKQMTGGGVEEMLESQAQEAV